MRASFRVSSSLLQSSDLGTSREFLVSSFMMTRRISTFCRLTFRTFQPYSPWLISETPGCSLSPLPKDMIILLLSPFRTFAMSSTIPHGIEIWGLEAESELVRKGVVKTTESSEANVHVLGSPNLILHSAHFGELSLANPSTLQEYSYLKDPGPQDVLAGLVWGDPDRRTAISVSRRGKISRTDVLTPKNHLLGASSVESGRFASISVSPQDPNILLAVTTTGTLFRWDLRSPTMPHSQITLKGPNHSVEAEIIQLWVRPLLVVFVPALPHIIPRSGLPPFL